MTNNEIIKALECCFDGYCRECAFDDDFNLNCKDNLIKNALDLINRQNAEIERLKGHLHRTGIAGIEDIDNLLKEMEGEE